MTRLQNNVSGWSDMFSRRLLFQWSSTIQSSCGTVALYGPLYIYIFADHRATVFTLSTTFETAQKKSCPAFCQFCHEIGCENDQTYIFRFVRYLSTFFYPYLPINIHFQFIIITNISFVTNPTYFVRHLASPVVSFWGHVIFSKYNPILTWPKIGE